MRMLTSSIQHMQRRRARHKQVRKVLQMLSESGVLRPSHIERRYFEVSVQADSLKRQVSSLESVADNSPARSLPWQKIGRIDLAALRHWIGSSRQARLQIEQ